MYHNFIVSKNHAFRNHIHGVFKGSDFVGWHAYDKGLKDQDVVGCFGSLGMGENLAVEVAQHSHLNVFRHYGALSEPRLVQHNSRFPSQQDFLQLDQIDDKVVIEYVPIGASALDISDSSSMIAASVCASETSPGCFLDSSWPNTVSAGLKSLLEGRTH